MKFTCDLKQLSEAVANVSLAISSRTSMQALESVLIECKDSTLTLTGYNLELGIIKNVEVSNTENGTILLNAKIFSDILRKMPSSVVTVSSDDRYLTVIRGGDTEFTILGSSAEEYPSIPEIDETNGFRIKQGLLKNMISQTLFAVAQNENTPIYTGSLFDLKNGELNLVSVDGYRLALRTEQINEEQEFNFVVPGKALSEVAKLLKDDQEEEVSLKVDKKHIIFEVTGYQIISRLLEGEFLDYHSAIGGDSKTKIKISTRVFSESLDRASIIITDRIRSPITAKMENNSITVSCMTSLGKVTDTVPVHLEGEDVTVGFNNRYMSDALRATGSDEVTLLVNGPFAPMKIVPLEGNSFTFLVLPVRLKTEG